MIIDSENEQLNDVVVFSVDAATELVWAFAAVVVVSPYSWFHLSWSISYLEKKRKRYKQIDEAEEDLINEIGAPSDNE